jgi:hypothetical protein
MVTSIINTFEFTIVAKKEGFENGTLPVSFTIE